MQVYIDTFRAQSAVQTISERAHVLMEDSEKLLKRVRRVTNGMQTEHADKTMKTVKEVEADLSLLRSEMTKLQAYMGELSAYIANYSRCGYHNSVMTNNYANVATEEVHFYLNNTKEFYSKTVSFQYQFDEEYTRIRQQLDSGIYKLEEDHAKCMDAQSVLTGKIERAQHKLEELQMKLEQLRRRLQELNAQINSLRARARDLRRAAAAVYIPPLRVWTDDDGNTHDNSQEVQAAQAHKARLLREAEQCDQQANVLQQEANLVQQEIDMVRAQIDELIILLQQMRETAIQLSLHLAEVNQCRQKLSDCRNSLHTIHSSCMDQCNSMRRECVEAEANLTRAAAELDQYVSVLLNDPKLRDWRLF